MRHPEPNGSRRATPLLLVQHRPGHSPYTASPPDVLTCDEKNLREHRILNCVGIIYTTNHKQGGMFLPAEDRRHFVAWSARKKADFKAGYWDEMWAWINNGGDAHVAAYLATYDISKFNPKAPPPQTPAFWEIVDSNRAPEQSELADVLDQMGNPQATTINLIAANCGFDSDFGAWLRERKNRPPSHTEWKGVGMLSCVMTLQTTDYGRYTANGKTFMLLAR